jgi:Uma2 family endonuclease
MIETRDAQTIAIDRASRRRFVMAELKALVEAGFFRPGEEPVLDRGVIVDANTGRLRRFSVDDLDRMDELGFFDGDDDDRFELVDGAILPVGGENLSMARVKPPHGAVIDRTSRRFSALVPHRAFARVQMPVHLGFEDEPQPDLAIVRPHAHEYFDRHPALEDLYLLIEVMDSTVWIDRNIKLPRYAASGVPEVWLIDLPGDILEVCRNPSGGLYEDRRVYGRGQTVAPLAFPDVVLSVDDLLGKAFMT